MNSIIKRLVSYEPSEDDSFIIKDEGKRVRYDVRDDKPPEEDASVIGDITADRIYMKKRFSIPKNNDIVMRDIKIGGRTEGFIVFIDGMVDTDMLDLAIIKPVLSLPLPDEGVLDREAVLKELICHSQVRTLDMYDDICEEINFGSCALFADGIDTAFVSDIRSWGTRSVERPENEKTIYGPQESFAEMLRNNSALVRKIIKTEKLICEGVKIGRVSKTRGVLMYIDDIANKCLVDEVRRRIEGIDVDYICAIDEVSLLLEENSFMITNQILSTERPDRTARALSEGRAALLLNGSSTALIFPTNAFEMLHSPSDAYMRLPYANAARLIRLLAMLSSLLLPGLYLAVTLFHQQLIPTYLMYAISASRENVPFPSVVEFFIMDISFELIREAGIRVPSAVGSALGIVGGIILGQAAISAKIASPIMIIIISITAIGSFATADYSLGWSWRILRVIFALLGASMGFFGLALGIFAYSVFLGRCYSFGVPYLSPLPHNRYTSTMDSMFVRPIWKRENRPEYLMTKNPKQEAKISRKWK